LTKKKIVGYNKNMLKGEKYMEQIKTKPTTIEEVEQRIEERRKKMNLPRIPELTEEEQEILDAIKMGLQEIADGEEGFSTEEVRRMLNIECK